MPLTYRGLVDRLVAHKILSAERASAALQGLGAWDSMDEEIDHDDIAPLLEDVGVAVSVHGEDVEELEESYREILQGAAALSGGSVVVTDVVLDTDKSVQLPLTFRVNGELRSWYEDHVASDYLDQLAVMEQISTLAPGGDDPRGFYGILSTESCSDHYYLLLTAEQAKALHDEFGLQLDAV